MCLKLKHIAVKDAYQDKQFHSIFRSLRGKKLAPSHGYSDGSVYFFFPLSLMAHMCWWEGERIGYCISY